MYFCLVILISLLYHTQSNAVETSAEDSVLLRPRKIVNTNIGPVEGVQSKGNTGKKVTAYLGIPYAEPPVGELRFRPPVPYQGKFQEPFKAHHNPATCYQSGPERALTLFKKIGYFPKRPYSEDCLQLNIYVPEKIPEKASVLVYFHAGAFYFGAAVAFFQTGETLASEENIIVVMFNYRLGALGFLSLAHEEAPGNVGLMDQQMALVFVQENIAAFGGNPDDVTIGGTSAGAASVGYHIMSPGSNGLFNKAILQSGVPANPWSFGSLKRVVKKSYQVAIDSGYKGKMDPSSVAKYLRSLDPDDLNKANQFGDFSADENVILPTVDGTFLRKDPDHAIVDALGVSHQNISLLIGSTSDEGSIAAVLFQPELFLRSEDHAINFNDYEQLVRNYGYGDQEAFAITRNYARKKKSGEPHYVRDLAIETVGDYLFVCDINEFSQILSDRGLKVYRYIFDIEQPYNLPNMPKFKGARHGSDALLLFGDYLGPNEDGIDDKTKAFLSLSRKVMHRFGNFIKHGDPNIEGVEPHFPLFKTQDGSVLVMKEGKDEIIHHMQSEECVLFKNTGPAAKNVSECAA